MRPRFEGLVPHGMKVTAGAGGVGHTDSSVREWSGIEAGAQLASLFHSAGRDHEVVPAIFRGGLPISTQSRNSITEKSGDVPPRRF